MCYHEKMRITRLKINKYKSIKDPLEISNISNLNILVGPNNAGKTNILDSVQCLLNTPEDDDRYFDENIDVEIEGTLNGESFFISNKKGELNTSGNFEKIKKSFVRIGETSPVQEIIPNNLKDFKEKYPNEYKDFSEALSFYFKDVEINEELFILSTQKKRSVKRMGEGFKRLFIILFYIFNPDYGLIFIDEPELHLHPSIIKKFLLLLREKKMDNQIFLTTHHPTFVQAHHLTDIWRVARNENESTSVYRFASKNIDINRFIQEINDDNSGMLFADKVLLVEGVSDRIFMVEMINRFYKKDKDIKVVYTSGKGTIDLYANLCYMFNIPYAIMLDSDAINSSALKRVKNYKPASHKKQRETLKEREIFILDRDLEETYPRKYRRRETKPLSALFVSKKITEEDLNEKRMEVIKEILERI